MQFPPPTKKISKQICLLVKGEFERKKDIEKIREREIEEIAVSKPFLKIG